jgi:hypothetical protein
MCVCNMLQVIKSILWCTPSCTISSMHYYLSTAAHKRIPEKVEPRLQSWLIGTGFPNRGSLIPFPVQKVMHSHSLLSIMHHLDLRDSIQHLHAQQPWLGMACCM